MSQQIHLFVHLNALKFRDLVDYKILQKNKIKIVL